MGILNTARCTKLGLIGAFVIIDKRQLNFIDFMYKIVNKYNEIQSYIENIHMMNSTWAWAYQYGVGGRGEGGLYLGRLYSNAKSRGRDIFDSELLLVFVHF